MVDFPVARKRWRPRRQYLEALGARLELVAVFDEDGERRVPIHLGKEPAA
jgi:hypothetical protein